jgi:hypothetical protein
LGWLEDDGDSDELAAGTMLDLPVYLAERLKSNGHVDVLTPRYYSTQIRNSLRADGEPPPLCTCGRNLHYGSPPFPSTI